MILDIVKLYLRYRIDFKEGGRHKHVRVGWVGTTCPFCTGNPGYHLGYCLKGKYEGQFICWRCGGKPIKKALAKLLRLPEEQVKGIIGEYSSGSGNVGYSLNDQKTDIRRKAFKFPSATKELFPHHAKYLAKRGFDPNQLVAKWGIKSTGPLSFLTTDGKELNYSHRIIIPIEWAGKIVSFQGRDVTGRHPLKYMACPKEREIIEHKNILYGEAHGEKAVLVEGATDVWKLGEGSLSCFGVKYRLPQIKILAKRYKELILLFDPDAAGSTQSEKIKAELNFRGVKVTIESSGEVDPGELSYEEAAYLMKTLGFKK